MVSCGTVVRLVGVLVVGDGVLVVGYSVGVPVDSRQYVQCICKCRYTIFMLII